MIASIITLNRSFWESLWPPLLTTIGVEFVVVFLIARYRHWDYMKLALLSIPINLVTNPIMNIVLTSLPTDYYWSFLVILEILVFVIEVFCYRWITKDFRVSFQVALAANITSLVLGILIG